MAITEVVDVEPRVPKKEVAPPPRRKVRLDDLASRFGVLGVWALLIVIFGILKPDQFLTFNNFRTMFESQSMLVLLSLALLISMISGDFDLSVAGIFSMDLVIIGKLNIVNHINPLVVIAGVMALSFLVGLIQAFIIVRFKLSSFIVTLGTGTAYMGIAFAINNTAVSGVSAGYTNFLSYTVGLQVAFWIALGVVLLLWYLYGYTPLGRRLFFVGASKNVARLAGIKVDRLRFCSLIAGSMLAGFAAVISAGYLNEADPTLASNFLLPALSAALLGTTCIWPGKPNPLGTFVATYFLVTGYTGLEELGLSSWIQQVFYGTALVVAVAVSSVAARRKGAESMSISPQ